MNAKLLIQMIFALMGGLGLMLTGMKFMSDGLQTVAGDRLRKLISFVTENRLLGTIMGLIVTCIVQSSSITTVMVIGLVNSGFMTLTQSVGVIFGANIGTTVTGWILTLNIGKYGLPLLGAASFFYLFAKRDRLRYAGMAIMGIGMVFLGLEIMSNGFRPLRDLEEYRMLFYAFDVNTYPEVLKCMLIGCVVTALVQSSSATLGMIMGLAMSGVIRFETAAALVLGTNIGTTITAWLASLGAGLNAKRAAYAHILFNLLGTVWVSLVFLPFYLPLIKFLLGHDPNTVEIRNGIEHYPFILAAIAMVHTGFNVVNTVVFLPLLKPLVALVNRIVPERGGIREVPHLAYLDARMVNTPELGVVQSQKELSSMAQDIDTMLEWLGNHITEGQDGKLELFEKIQNQETVLDHAQDEIAGFLGRLVSGQISHAVMDTARRHLRLADEYESLGDYVLSAAKGIRILRRNDLRLLPQEQEDLLALHQSVGKYVHAVRMAMENDDVNCMSWAKQDSREIVKLMKECRQRHLVLLSSHDMPPLQSTVYMNMLNYYRRMRDHALNIAETIGREK